MLNLFLSASPFLLYSPGNVDIFLELSYKSCALLGGFLLGRTLALLTTTTLATSMAARQGPLAMAAHQVCFQVWLAVSLLTDPLAVSAQV